MPKIIRRAFKWTLYPVIAVFALLLYLVGLWATGNFHEIIPGELYRSAQLSESEIHHYTQKYGIRTILNLRGENVGKPWYDEEVAASKANNLTLINYPMLSRKHLNEKEAAALIELMRNAPKPILIHCQAGANRTALASALYMAGVKHRSEFISELQLSPIYGHVPLWFSPAYAMDESFESLEPMLGFNGS